MINSVDKKINIISHIVVVLVFLMGILCFFFYESGYDNIKGSKEHYNICKEYMNGEQKEKGELVTKYGEIYGLDDETCSEIIKYDVTTNSTLYLFCNIIRSIFLDMIIPFFIPILLLFPILYIITNKFRSREIKNYLLRDSYKNYIKRIFKLAYSNIFIVPFMLLIIFILCYILSGNMNPIADINSMMLTDRVMDLYKNPLFYILYTIVIFLNIGMYDNIALIISSKNKNFLVAYVESFLVIYIIWCISDILFGLFFQKVFGIFASNFSLSVIYLWTGVDNMLIFFLTNVFWYILTLIIAILSYKNKEKIISMCER